MKKKAGVYFAVGLAGIAFALAARFFLQGALSQSQAGAMIGVGAGLFGYGVGNGCVALWGEKHPDLMRQSEIEEKDERNVAILNRAKAKALDMMFYVFGALMISLALMGADIGVVLLLVAAYLFVAGCMVYYMCKYQKEM